MLSRPSGTIHAWLGVSLFDEGSRFHSAFLRSLRIRSENRIVSYTFAMLLSPREAAQRLGISYPTIKQWLYRGKIKAIKTPGGHYRIPEAELDGLLHQAKRPETPKREMLRSLSGRNQLTGRIVELKIDGLLAQVKLSIGGQIITSIITSDAAREMQLKVGETAAALIKSTEVMVLRV
jgi:molybdopterin-binding protein